jgi:hypothetical protein
MKQIDDQESAVGGKEVTNESDWLPKKYVGRKKVTYESQ